MSLGLQKFSNIFNSNIHGQSNALDFVKKLQGTVHEQARATSASRPLSPAIERSSTP
jgi:hypothetical protein